MTVEVRITRSRCGHRPRCPSLPQGTQVVHRGPTIRFRTPQQPRQIFFSLAAVRASSSMNGSL